MARSGETRSTLVVKLEQDWVGSSLRVGHNLQALEVEVRVRWEPHEGCGVMAMLLSEAEITEGGKGCCHYPGVGQHS
jgi:hypothetical protein